MLLRHALLVGLLGLSTAAGVCAGEANSRGAASPRGHYAALDKLPDWGGVWVLSRSPPGQARTPPQLKGSYLAGYEAWQKYSRENNGVAKREVSNCMPPGMPRMMGTGQYPLEFLFTPGRVTIQHEAWMQTRSIFTDGRGHPEDLEAGIFGHSIGRWEGDTLVVDTVGIKTITEIEPGMKHSDKLRITERIRLAPGDPDTLVVEMTMEDPEALATPYRRTHSFKRERDWNLMEFICAENDRNPIGQDGLTLFE
jgi:hypothetical protein